MGTSVNASTNSSTIALPSKEGKYTIVQGKPKFPYPGVDWLGVGYDLIRGNPDGDDANGNIDPGAPCGSQWPK